MGALVVKRVLMIAFHFPPQRGSSGVQRTLKFAHYLPAHGWQPSVLTAAPRAHALTGSEQLGAIAADLEVRRAFALDTARHLSFKGRYLGWMALPDRWVSWWLGAVPAGMAMLRRLRPDVLWSTYPIATAHLIGLTLHRLSGIAWVADMRDPMVDDEYPRGRMPRKVAAWIEARTVASCTRLVCTTPGAIRNYRARYPAIPAERFVLIENGYDEEDFSAAELVPAPAREPGAALVLLHSGIIYPSERDPRPLFAALAALLQDGRIAGRRLRVVLRAAVHEDLLRALRAEHGLEEVVDIAPPLPYREALAEMLAADGLLLLQAANCNAQIPAKLYEYLRARRPILALTDTAGDTAQAMRDAGIDNIAPLDEQLAITAALTSFVEALAGNRAPLPTEAVVRSHARSARSAQLAALLDLVSAQGRQAAMSSKAP
jgi:glycosyltransferase involved in cell wall biosynthesis